MKFEIILCMKSAAHQNENRSTVCINFYDTVYDSKEQKGNTVSCFVLCKTGDMETYLDYREYTSGIN